MIKLFKKQEGQALLVIVLVMIIALTVGLSLISRSITTLETSKEEADSQAALSAAEAGVEKVIQDPNQKTDLPKSIGQGTYTTSITAIDGSSFNLGGGDLIQRDDSVDIWLSKYSTDPAQIYTQPTTTFFEIEFGTSSTACDNPALEIDVISGDKTNPSFARYAYDPCDSRRSSNNFSQTGGGSVDPITSGGTTINYKRVTDILSVTNGLFIRVTPIYKDANIGIKTCSTAISCASPGASLPSQGSSIVSTGVSGSTKRKITVFQGYPKIPAEFFPYSIFIP